MVLFTPLWRVYVVFAYFLQTQLQSATEQLSDEQHPASQEQSGHPEFPQLQPIANSAAKANNVIVFFIKFILSTLALEPQTHGKHPQCGQPFRSVFSVKSISILRPLSFVYFKRNINGGYKAFIVKVADDFFRFFLRYVIKSIVNDDFSTKNTNVKVVNDDCVHHR